MLSIVHVRGKGGRHVPLLVEKRAAVGVCPHNLYLFPAPTRQSKKPLRGYQCMGNVIKRVSERIRSTKLHKYVATVAQILNLTEGEFEWLSMHLGYSLNVHKEYCRLHDFLYQKDFISRNLYGDFSDIYFWNVGIWKDTNHWHGHPTRMYSK